MYFLHEHFHFSLKVLISLRPLGNTALTSKISFFKGSISVVRVWCIKTWKNSCFFHPLPLLPSEILTFLVTSGAIYAWKSTHFGSYFPKKAQDILRSLFKWLFPGVISKLWLQICASHALSRWEVKVFRKKKLCQTFYLWDFFCCVCLRTLCHSCILY